MCMYMYMYMWSCDWTWTGLSPLPVPPCAAVMAALTSDHIAGPGLDDDVVRSG